MSFFDTLKVGLNTAVDTISAVAHNLVDQSRTNARLNRLRTVMKSESELMNRAYIALGKDYYERIKKGEKPNSEREEKLVQLIDNCKAKIAKARDCYRKIIESRNEFIFTTVNSTPAEEPHFEKEDRRAVLKIKKCLSGLSRDAVGRKGFCFAPQTTKRLPWGSRSCCSTFCD